MLLLIMLLSFLLVVWIGISQGVECPIEGNDDKLMNIYFLHTSNEQQEVPQVARCSIESAARVYKPGTAAIWVFSNGWDLGDMQERFPHVRRISMDPEGIFGQIELLRDWYRSSVWQQGHRFHHLSDAIRLALLYQCGGLYMDTDVISVRSLLDGSFRHDSLVGVEKEADANGPQVMCNAVLMFRKPRDGFVFELIKEFVSRFNATTFFGWNGPQVISRVWGKPIAKEDVHLVPPTAFYALPWHQVGHLFRENLFLEDIIVTEKDDGFPTYGVHLWQSQVKGQLQYLETDYQNTLVGHLFHLFCPDSFHPDPLEMGWALQGRITFPPSGQQLYGTGPIPVKLEIEMKNPQQSVDLNGAVVCFEMNGAWIESCAPIDSSTIELSNPGPGHYLLKAEVCSGDPSHVELASAPVHCLNGRKGKLLAKRGLTSFSIDFHSIQAH